MGGSDTSNPKTGIKGGGRTCQTFFFYLQPQPPRILEGLFLENMQLHAIGYTWFPLYPCPDFIEGSDIAGIAHVADPLVSVLKLLHAAVMVQIELTSSLTQNPKSHPISVSLGEFWREFAGLCHRCSVSVDGWRASICRHLQRWFSSFLEHKRLIISLELICILRL